MLLDFSNIIFNKLSYVNLVPLIGWYQLGKVISEVGKGYELFNLNVCTLLSILSYTYCSVEFILMINCVGITVKGLIACPCSSNCYF